jgi:hypothetical protein
VPGEVCTVVPESGSRISIGYRVIARHRNERPPPHQLTPRSGSELESWSLGLPGDSRHSGRPEIPARIVMAPTATGAGMGLSRGHGKSLDPPWS